jgi:hypothetical protein
MQIPGTGMLRCTALREKSNGTTQSGTASRKKTRCFGDAVSACLEGTTIGRFHQLILFAKMDAREALLRDPKRIISKMVQTRPLIVAISVSETAIIGRLKSGGNQGRDGHLPERSSFGAPNFCPSTTTTFPLLTIFTKRLTHSNHSTVY